MRVVLQRVKEASVTVAGTTISSIKHGLLIFVGIETEDTQEDIDWLVPKITKLRIFNDAANLMNLSLLDCKGEVLVVSQFTLHAKTKKGNRPSYLKAARPEKAIPLYESFIETLQIQLSTKVQTGIFGATMEVALVNDGPVTILIDTKDSD